MCSLWFCLFDSNPEHCLFYRFSKNRQKCRCLKVLNQFLIKFHEYHQKRLTNGRNMSLAQSLVRATSGCKQLLLILLSFQAIISSFHTHICRPNKTTSIPKTFLLHFLKIWKIKMTYVHATTHAFPFKSRALFRRSICAVRSIMAFCRNSHIGTTNKLFYSQIFC